MTHHLTAAFGFEGDTSLFVSVEKAVFRTVFLVFQWERISVETDRRTVLQTFFNYCGDGNPRIFTDGFESGDTSDWSSSQP